MKYLNAFSLTLITLLMLLISAPDADARAFRVAKLPGGGPDFGCAACHVNPGGGGEKNAFGMDYEAIALAAGDLYTDELGQKDSDGDGFSNDEEFNADPPTEPWNPDSHPPRVQAAVEPYGKMFAIWARLKLEPVGLGRNFDSASVNAVPEPPNALKRSPKPTRQTDAAAVAKKRAAVKNRRQSDSKRSAIKSEKKLKAKAKSRTRRN